MNHVQCRTKLFILVLFLLMGLVGLGTSTLLLMQSMHQSSKMLANYQLPACILAEEMNTTLSDMRTNEYKHVVSQDTAEMEQIKTQLDDLTAAFEQQYYDYRAYVITDTEIDMLKDMQNTWNDYLAIQKNMLEISTANRTEEALALLDQESQPIFANLTTKCRTLLDYTISHSDLMNAAADATYASTRNIILGITAGSILITLFASIYIIRLCKPSQHQVNAKD